MRKVDEVGRGRRLLMEWKNGGLEYLKNRKGRRVRGLKCAGVLCMDKRNGNLHDGHPLEGVPRNRPPSRKMGVS